MCEPRTSFSPAIRKAFSPAHFSYLEFSCSRERSSVCGNVAVMLFGIHFLCLFYNSIICSETVSHRAHTFGWCFDGISVASPRHPDFPAEWRCVAAWAPDCARAALQDRGAASESGARVFRGVEAPGEWREGVGPQAAGPHFALPRGGSRGGCLARYRACGREGPSLCVQAA